MMDRVKIKEAAKARIRGNKWNIIWPALVISTLQSILQNIFGLNPYASANVSDLKSLSEYHVSPQVSLGITGLGLAIGIVTVAYKKYILYFVRNGKFDFNVIIDCIKEKWLNILISEILVTVIVSLCMMLFVIPGIIMGLAYAMTAYLVVDTEVTGPDSLKESRMMMKGYKWNYFVFYLSFIGWILLAPFTLFILLIWLYPYMTVADALYYEELKKVTGK